MKRRDPIGLALIAVGLVLLAWIAYARLG
jgi:hypothetical protein